MKTIEKEVKTTIVPVII